MEQLRILNGIPAPTPRTDEFLGWDELRQLDRHPLVTLGAHSHAHPLLTALSWRDAWSEIRRSKRDLETRLERPIAAFAYPYGGFGRAVRQLVRLAGFRYAVTTQPRVLTPGNAMDRFALPRIDLKRLVGEPVTPHA